jgi:hypothetical protein
MVLDNLASKVTSWATDCELKLITVHLWWLFSYASVVFVPKLKWLCKTEYQSLQNFLNLFAQHLLMDTYCKHWNLWHIGKWNTSVLVSITQYKQHSTCQLQTQEYIVNHSQGGNCTIRKVHTTCVWCVTISEPKILEHTLHRCTAYQRNITEAKTKPSKFMLFMPTILWCFPT